MKIVTCLQLQLPLLFLCLFPFISLAFQLNTNHQEILQCLVTNSTSMSEVTYAPTNSSYTSILEFSIVNQRFARPETPKPLVIVTPKEESQIQTVIYCCKKHDIQMKIRGAGNDFEGLSFVSDIPFVLLDMINLRHIDVDPVAASATIQSGATAGEVYYAVAQKSKTLGFIGPSFATVGVTGFIGHGGYGTLRRKYGLAADNIIDARIMDANGNILDRKSMGEDLFWAIRGGGPSSFGVILSWKIKLVSVPETVTIFTVKRTIEQNATEIVHRWQTIAPNLPRDAEMRINAYPTKDVSNSRPRGDHITVVVEFVGTYLGTIDKLVPMMQERFPELNLVKEDCSEVSYTQSAMDFPLNLPIRPPEVLLHRSAFKLPTKVKSGHVTSPISKQGLQGMWDMLLKFPNGTYIVFTSFGGIMDEISESAIPYPHRPGVLYMLFLRVRTPEGTTAPFTWIRSFYSYLAPYVVSPRTAYAADSDLDLGVNNQSGVTNYTQASKWGKMYFKNNFDRLVHIKSKVDPTNFFRHEQTIPPL
ncbi:Cannabidiolic acid synthase [Heracleum sosnowskyi]|uniref:Cannabidiolic acid synthase n=1 Tax=Heracleum sosnowskyi TaxID=360622 RepID=A0AAD8N8Z5_9APIA|nr:Cannabidiolic acid synthase [Heracleum sosnowskyi]